MGDILSLTCNRQERSLNLSSAPYNPEFFRSLRLGISSRRSLRTSLPDEPDDPFKRAARAEERADERSRAVGAALLRSQRAIDKSRAMLELARKRRRQD
jgi:hypothetical protein